MRHESRVQFVPIRPYVSLSDPSPYSAPDRSSRERGGNPIVLHEKTFQARVVDYLVEQNGFRRGNDNEVDRDKALLVADLVAFVKATQPDAWAYFERFSGPSEELALCVSRDIRSRGVFTVLRDGIALPNGLTLRLAYRKPASSRNPSAVALAEENIFTAVEELHFERQAASVGPDRPRIGGRHRIDCTIFLNGIPLVASELKNETTGSTLDDAEYQWKTSRNPEEPLLSSNSGFLVYFGVSHAEASFTTFLNKAKTVFLPFNKGENNGSGNPEDDVDQFGHRTHYLWKEVWTKESLLDILFNFMHLEPNDSGPDLLIFPRYHQLDFLRKMERILSAGDFASMAWLVQHSAGSGKTKSIAWLANLANSIHDANNSSVFDLVLVVTDRTVIDRQLQFAVEASSHAAGSIGVVDKNSKQLAGFLKDGKRVIVCTVQKFSYVREILSELSQDKSRRVLVIIDEAHSGQTGQYQENLRDAVLPNGTAEQRRTAEEETEEDEGSPTILDNLVDSDMQVASNISYVAFTATPRKDTMERFATSGKPFHLYSMRQAIEEGFILDVLQNYRRTDVRVRLDYFGVDEELTSKMEASKALGRKVRSTPNILRAKAEVVLNTTVDQVLPNARGEGKAMVVCSSRLEVCRWMKTIKEMIAENPERYSAIKPIAAFTGSVNFEDELGVTESTLNGFSETQTTDRFDQEGNLLIVANKYQTGFNQPKLCAMFLDRKISGVAAVQTLSRLNRTYKGKAAVLVIDFQDSADAIREAFSEYYVNSNFDPDREVTTEGLVATAQRLYSDRFGVITPINAATYTYARRRLALDESDVDAEQSVRAVTLSISDSLSGLRRRDRSLFTEFRRLAGQYLSDCLFYSQTHRLEQRSLIELRNLLKIVVLLAKRPRDPIDLDWLDYVSVALLGTRTEDQDIDIAEPEKPKPKEGNSDSTAGPLDGPVTVEELIAEWNSRYLDVLRGMLEENSGESLVWEGGGESAMRGIMRALASEAKDDDALVEHARDKSFDMFNGSAGQDMAHHLISRVVARRMGSVDKDETQMANAFFKAYRNSRDPQHELSKHFSEGIITFVLKVAYSQAE